MKNLFNETMHFYTGENCISTAWRYATDLAQAAFSDEYKKTTPEQLSHFVKSAVCNLDEYGLCSVLRGVKMPADARSDMMYHTSYVIAAAGIYLMTHHKGLLCEVETEALSRMMSVAFKLGIVVHGYDDAGRKNKIMAMLGRAGGAELISTHPEFCPVFNENVEYFLRDCKDAGWESNPTGFLMKYDGFSTELQNLELRWALSCWQGKPNAVFTYGTLMKGQRAEALLGSANWGGNCYLKDYALYNLGRYPGIKKMSGECTLGELWFVDDAAMVALDKYEGEGTLYQRKKVVVASAYGSIEAYAYIYNHSTSGDIIHGKWGNAGSNHIWYAAYGSSMSKDRFACYIQGGLCEENGRVYRGCADKTLWTNSYFTTVRGQMYFGRESRTWSGGVAFYNDCGYGATYVRLYRITREQLDDVMTQEGASPEWYGHIKCLGVERNGEPIYTLTSNKPHKHNTPSDSYLQLIRKALITEAKLAPKETDRYLKDCMK